MAEKTVLPSQDGSPGWRERLHQEEMSGFAFAFKARSIALGVIVAWLMLSSSPGRLPVSVGIGLHFGAVIQGNVGIADQLEFTTIGDTVNVASRLEAMTRQHGVGIPMSRNVVDAAERQDGLPPEIKTRLRDLGPVAIVGHDASVHLFAIAREQSP